MKRRELVRATLLVLAASSLFACASSAHAPAHDPSATPTPASAPPSQSVRMDAPATYAMRESPDAPFRASAPPIGDTPAATPPPVHSFRLTNGVSVLFLEQHTPGFLRVEVLLPTRPAPIGANAMAAHALWLGTEGMTQAQLQAANDADNAEMTSRCDWRWIRVAMTSTSDRAASSIARLAKVVLSPAFPANDVVRITRETAREREPFDEAPRSIAARVTPVALYGLASLDEEAGELRSADVGALRRDDIANAYDAALDPATASILVVGDATEKTLRPMLEKSFGAWHAHGKRTPLKKSARLAVATSTPRIVVVDRPGPSSVVTFTGEGPTYGSPDWAPALALRMMTNGRQGRAASVLHAVNPAAPNNALSLSATPDAPRIALTTDVATASTADLLTGVDRWMRTMKTAEITPKEVEDARTPLAMEDPAWTSSLTDEIDALEGLVVQGLPRDDLSKRTARLRAISVDDVHRVAGRYLDPDRMKVILVGDWAKLRAPLTALGWGPVEVRDSSGRIDAARGTR